jgi:Berberine and berberine like
LKNAAPYAYVNYALFRTPLEVMYGEHLERLREIKKRYDPEDVMGLAGMEIQCLIQGPCFR